MTTHRRGAAEWAVLIDEWRQSGLSLPEFCRRRGLLRSTMQGWIYKPNLKRAVEVARLQAQGIKTKQSQSDTPTESVPSQSEPISNSVKSYPPAAFLPVRFDERTTESTNHADRAAIEVILRGGRRIAVGPGFDDETLRQVVAALES